MADIKTAYDHSLFGGIDSDGKIRQVWGKDALKNSILMWFALFKGEVLRNPVIGGYLTSLLTKPMSQTKAEDIREEIYRGIYNEFKPELKDIEIFVVPVYDKRYWQITLKAYCPDIKEYVEVNEKIKNIA